MLIVMAIITLISSMLVVMLAGAHQDSNKLRTAAQVRRIDSLIQEQWEELQYKPIRLLPARLTFLNLPANANNLQLARGMRLQGIRELYRMELPDRIQDIANDPAFIEPSPSFLNYRLKVLQTYAAISSDPNVVFGTAPAFNNGLWTRAHEGAECLFLILSTMRDEDGDMLRFFNGVNMGDTNGDGIVEWGGTELGDVDGDGMPEILDQWGQPIEFLRWAPGYGSPLQTQDPTTSPDPLDPYKIDARWTTPDNGLQPYLLMPLIFSAGPDTEFGVAFLHDNYQLNDPYAWDSTNTYLIGTRINISTLQPDNRAADNIDNHWDYR